MHKLLEVENLAVEFKLAGNRKKKFRAVDHVSFSVAESETVALVGESGSGKSTIGRAILGLTPVQEGTIRFDGRDVTYRSRQEQRVLARDLQVVFQDPYSSLNPSKTIGTSLAEPMRAQKDHSATDPDKRVKELLQRVGLPSDAAERYPAKFSGGQRQRIAIARALVLGPKLVICDEPTSALDVSTQAQVLDLLKELQDQFQLGYLFITHDLAVVRHFAHRVLVLRHGQLVEQGTAQQVCENPLEIYTKELVAAAPVPHPALQLTRRQARLTMMTTPLVEAREDLS